VHRPSAAVAEALVTADVHLALDVLRDLTTQVALDLEVLVDERADPGDLFIREVTDAGGGIDLGRFADLLCSCLTDSVDVGQGDPGLLLSGDVDAGDACHVVSVPVSLSPGAACGAGCCR
jgi:hypothetical protein